MCILASCADPTSPGVWWRDDALWVQYGPLASRHILEAYLSGKAFVDLSHLVDTQLPPTTVYRVDLDNMKQINQSSNYEREIRIIIPPLDQGTDIRDVSQDYDLKPFQKDVTVLQSFLNDLTVLLQKYVPREMVSFRTKVLEALFDKLCDEEVVMRSITPLVHPHVVKLCKNSSNCSPVEGERAKFVDVMQALAAENPSLEDEVVMKLLKGQEVAETGDTLIRYVFMGAQAKDVDNMLKQGSMQGYEGRPGFKWFGLKASTSLPYCSGQYPKVGAYRILVVLAVPRQDLCLQKKRGLRVADTTYSLPLATADIIVL